jgi:prepilin-type processing-associated H-X9-DG protein
MEILVTVSHQVKRKVLTLYVPRALILNTSASIRTASIMRLLSASAVAFLAAASASALIFYSTEQMQREKGSNIVYFDGSVSCNNIPLFQRPCAPVPKKGELVPPDVLFHF